MIEMGARIAATYKLRRCHIQRSLLNSDDIKPNADWCTSGKNLKQFEIVAYL